MLEILYFIGIVLAGCPLILNTAQDCRLQAYAASSTYCRQFGISGPAHRDCQGNARGLLKECMQSVLYDNHSFCWTFGIVHRSHAKDFPRGYLGWQEPGHTNVKPFPWKCPHAKYKCIQWDGYGWTGYRPSRWGQRFDEEEEALARLPANLRPQFPKDRTGTYEYQAEKEQSIRLELDSLEKK